MDDNIGAANAGLAVPVGVYVKDDGGVSFAIQNGLLFVFRGASQPMRRPATTSDDDESDSSFTITWEWGTPTFVLQDDGVTLIEDGAHRFRLTKPHPYATVEQMCHFRDAGYLLMPDCVPRAAIDAALRSAAVADTKRRAAENGNDGWSTGGGDDSELIALARYVWPTVQKICGGTEDVKPPTWAQVAVKAVDVAPNSTAGGAYRVPGAIPPDAHIDGLHDGSNGIPPGAIHNFSMLVGIALTDMPSPNMGNLSIFPCSHRAVARAFTRVGGIEAAARILSAQNGSSPTKRLDQLVRLRDLAPSQPVCCLAGAAVIAHYATIHSVEPNYVGTEPRVMVYFRVTSPARGNRGHTRLEALTPDGLFMEMAGVQALPA